MIDPELWRPGEVRSIPRLYGRAYDCTITRITSSHIEFRGPTGAGSITRSLYRHLTGGHSR